MNRTYAVRAFAGALLAGYAVLPAPTIRAAGAVPSITVLGGNVAQSDNAANPGTYLSITGVGFTAGGRVAIRVLDASGAMLFDSASMLVQPQASTPDNDRAWQPTAAKGAVFTGGHIGMQVRIPPMSKHAASVMATDMASSQQVATNTSVGF